jgi:glyoxylase-like metal-dependent hydrolase (beta-lactamase superfamily II)
MTSKRLGASRPTFHRFRLGGFEITSVYDGARVRPGPHPSFGADQPASVVEAYAAENFMPVGQMVNYYTPTILDTGRQLVVFDTGNEPSNKPAVGHFVDNLKAAGYDPADVDVVVITHCHVDHIAGTMIDGRPVFPNARYVVGQVEYDFWNAPGIGSSPWAERARLIPTHVTPFAERMTFVKEGDAALPGVTAIEAFGHSPGHMAFLLESEGKQLMLWGDVCNHHVLSLEKPDWHVGFDQDKETAAATRRKILGMVAADRIPVTGYHMPFPSLGFVERKGTGYRWVPVSYQFDV